MNKTFHKYFVCSKLFCLIVRFGSCCWIGSLVAGGGSWQLRVKGTLTTRTDTGSVNSSPVSAISPVVRLLHGCSHTIRIPGMLVKVHMLTLTATLILNHVNMKFEFISVPSLIPLLTVIRAWIYGCTFIIICKQLFTLLESELHMHSGRC